MPGMPGMITFAPDDVSRYNRLDEFGGVIALVFNAELPF